MTVRDLAGLAVLNAAYLVVGLSLLWAARDLPTWGTVLRLAGLAYLVGVAALGIVWTLLVIAGVPFGGWTILLTLAGVTSSGVVVAHRLHRSRPRGLGHPATVPLVSAAGIAAAGVFLEALFRASRLQPLLAFDGWAFWIPKAKALYFFGGLDEQLFTTLPGPTYPPLVPLLDAAAFHAMGGTHVVTLHVQFWFFTLGFVAALAGVLAPHARPWLLWPALLLLLVVPRTNERLFTPQADFLVDYFFVLAAVLLVLWLDLGDRWRLVAITVLLSGAVLTKREGVLFAACLLVAALAATVRRRRVAWPPLLLIGGVVVACGVPWRLWYRAHGIGGEAPPGGGAESSLSRAADAVRLSLDVLFDNGLWSVVPMVGVIAIALALVWGRRAQGVFALGLLTLIVLGGAWITTAYTELPVTANEALNPIVRYTAAEVILLACLAPVLLEQVWRRAEVLQR